MSTPKFLPPTGGSRREELVYVLARVLVQQACQAQHTPHQVVQSDRIRKYEMLVMYACCNLYPPK
jgi:hypothetical protein